jgi:hypothetical protein
MYGYLAPRQLAVLKYARSHPGQFEGTDSGQNARFGRLAIAREQVLQARSAGHRCWSPTKTETLDATKLSSPFARHLGSPANGVPNAKISAAST